jgi:hypothetical protein
VNIHDVVFVCFPEAKWKKKKKKERKKDVYSYKMGRGETTSETESIPSAENSN